LSIVGTSAKARTACMAGKREYFRAFIGFLTVAILVVALGLTGCSRGGGGNTGLSKRVVEIGDPVPKGGGRYKVGDPYKINGRWFRPVEDPGYDRTGIASWYGELFHGRYTANGEIFDMDALTAAHTTMPLPSYAEVTNLENGRRIVVRVNDRGPYAHNRLIDLSKRSAYALGIYRAGTGKVRVRYVGKAPIDGNDSYERRVLASQPWARMATGYKPAHPGAAIDLARIRREEPAVADIAPVERKVAMPYRRPGQRPEPVVLASVAEAPMTTGGASPATSGEPATAAFREEPAQRPALHEQRGNLIFVQAGSFRDESNARQVRDRLSAFGPVHVFPAEVAGDIWYRVRLGPFKGDDSANTALEKVVASGARGATIVRN